jgi:hypothetical protein
MNEITVTLNDIRNWDGCIDGADWFKHTVGEQATLEDAIAKCPDKGWVAWYLYRAGRAWSDERWDARIAEALIATSDAEYLYWAGYDWSDERKASLHGCMMINGMI